MYNMYVYRCMYVLVSIGYKGGVAVIAPGRSIARRDIKCPRYALQIYRDGSFRVADKSKFSSEPPDQRNKSAKTRK